MIAAVVLAAGRSERMGRPKALLPCGQTTFLGAILDSLSRSRAGPVRVVLGHGAAEVRDAMRLPEEICVLNARYDAGMLSSVQCGVRSLPREAAGFLLWPVDHPRVDTSTVDALVEAFESGGAPIVLPVHAGRRGHPVLFAAALFGELLEAPEALGARAVVRRHEAALLALAVADPGVIADIDTPEAYRTEFGLPLPRPIDSAKRGDVPSRESRVENTHAHARRAGGPSMSAVEHIRQRHDQHLEQLQALLRIPSISTEKERASDVRRAAEWVRDRLREAGCTLAEIHETPRHPIVYGEWLGAPGKPTVLVYGHYDVQPVDPIDLWVTPPFEPTIRDGRIYARGSSDDKGQFIIHINALEAHLGASGACPVNLKFLIEGEEEIGSLHLDEFLTGNAERLACDVVVVSDTAMFAKGIPSICHGLRGLAYLQIDVIGTNRDLHSGTFGGAVINPIFALTRILAALKDERGKVRVPGFYDRVRKLTAKERKAFASLPHSDAKYKKAIGAPELFGEPGFTTLERTWARPTLEINGIWGGFTGQGAKTVIPAEAHAKVSMRLVPHQTPDEIAKKVQAYVKRIAPKAVKVAVERLHGGDAWLAETDHPALQAAGRAVKRAFGKAPVFVLEGGSIPVIASFSRVLKVPAVLLGIGLNDDNLHAPNEKLELENFRLGNEAAALLMEEIGATDMGRRKAKR